MAGFISNWSNFLSKFGRKGKKGGADDRIEPSPTPAPGSAPPPSESLTGMPPGLAKPKVNVKISPDAQGKRIKTKWMVVGGIVILGVIGFVSMTQPSHGPAPTNNNNADDTIDLTPPGVEKQSFDAQAQTSIDQLKKQLQSDQQFQKQMELKMDAQSKQLAALENRPTSPAPAAGGVTLPPPSQPGTNISALPQAPPPPPKMPSDKTPTPGANVEPMQPEAPQPKVFVPPADNAGNAVGSSEIYKQNPYAGYIPSGSFAPGALLTGIEAGTSEQSSGNPQPVLIRVQRDAVLPGYSGYKVASCFVLGSSYGSLSSQRAYVRLASLSCVDKHNRRLIDASIKGYVADSDGMFGLRGTVVERRGALLAKSLLAGFAGGLGTALSQAQGTVYSGSFGSGQTISGSNILKSAGFSGAGNAANMLAQFYLKQAQQIFPVIEVPPRRKVTMVVTTGTQLHWSDDHDLYVKTITPQQK